jgi:cytoskeletal protein CcmA (bactofilin family)
MFRKKSAAIDGPAKGAYNSPAINLISEGTELTGNFKSDHGIRISGLILGSIQISGKCILSSTGKVEGDILALDADISGTVKGDIIVFNKLTLRQKSIVTGNIRAKSICIEDGATFEGSCTMSADPASEKEEFSLDFNIRQITQAYRGL